MENCCLLTGYCGNHWILYRHSRSFCNLTESGFGDGVIFFYLNFIIVNVPGVSAKNGMDLSQTKWYLYWGMMAALSTSLKSPTGLLFKPNCSILNLTSALTECLSFLFLFGICIAKNPKLCCYLIFFYLHGESPQLKEMTVRKPTNVSHVFT